MDTVETTESVSTPEPSEEPASTPEAGEVSQTSDKESGEVEVQLSPKAQQRMQRLANEAREAKKIRAEYEKLQGKYKEAEGALVIDSMLRENPQLASQFLELVHKLKNPGPQEDPYAKYNPEIQELAKTAQELRNWKQQQEQREQQTREENVQKNQSDLDEHFDSLLRSKGFIDEKGNFDEGEVEVLSNATLAFLARSMQDPRLASQKQVEQALDKVLSGLQSLEKRTLKKAVKQPGVPASGTGSGKVASQKVDYSNPDNRIAFLANALKG